jgi:hypothetical protein
MQSKLSAPQGLGVAGQVAPLIKPAYTIEHPPEEDGLE